MPSSGGRYVGPYTIRHSRPVYENPWIRVREDRVAYREGEESTFGVVAMKPGVSVLALHDDSTVYLVREFKYALGDYSLEVVSGAIESGETPDVAALRELEEEVGLIGSEWIDMGTIDPFTTVIHSPNHLFLCRGLTKTRRIRRTQERLEVVTMSMDDALYAVLRGQITHGASCVVILKAKLFLEQAGRRP